MPELPEVESIKNYLIPRYEGKILHTLEAVNEKQIIGDVKGIESKRIIKIGRHGKVMILALDDSLEIHIHLKMSGRVSNSPNIHTRAILYFADAPTLYFNDPRKFGWVKIGKNIGKSKGIDCLDSNFTLLYFCNLVERSKKNIKSLLLDQAVIAGIGNIYANDALWEAGISPLRISESLSVSERKKLYTAIKLVISEGIRHGGSSKTYVYRLPDGTKGHYQDHFRVYDQEDMPCKRCGARIIRMKQNGRSTWMCKKCQR